MYGVCKGCQTIDGRARVLKRSGYSGGVLVGCAQPEPKHSCDQQDHADHDFNMHDVVP